MPYAIARLYQGQPNTPLEDADTALYLVIRSQVRIIRPYPAIYKRVGGGLLGAPTLEDIQNHLRLIKAYGPYCPDPILVRRIASQMGIDWFAQANEESCFTTKATRYGPVLVYEPAEEDPEYAQHRAYLRSLDAYQLSSPAKEAEGVWYTVRPYNLFFGPAFPCTP